MKDVILIPAYNPDDKLAELVDALSETPNPPTIVVVDDGSSEASSAIFARIKGKAAILVHKENQGKGAAIKTALRYISRLSEEPFGIVTVDADGQHSHEDARRLLRRLEDSPESLILGVRAFSGDIPWKSRWGNTISRFTFRLLSGVKVSDTQTGLRAFGSGLIPFLLAVDGDRYEYEMNTLVSAAKNGIKISEVPIATIYNDQANSASHFRAVRDSMRVYGSLFLYAGSSFLSFLVDYALFIVFSWTFGFFVSEYAVVFGNILARIFSASVNYYLNSTYVFRSGRRAKSMLEYFALAGCILVVNTAIIRSFDVYTAIPKQVYKIATEMLLWIVSYLVQKLIIFRPKK